MLQQTSPRDPIVEPAHAEPDVIARERSALRELLDLISERAGAEAAVESARASASAKADEQYHKARQALASRLEILERTAVQMDEERRRAIVDAAIAGESQAKSEFAKVSRRIAAEYESVRENAGIAFHRAKSEVTAGFEAGERDAAREFAKARKPIDDAMRLSESYRARLESLFNDYKKLGLADPKTTPTRE